MRNLKDLILNEWEKAWFSDEKITIQSINGMEVSLKVYGNVSNLEDSQESSKGIDNIQGKNINREDKHKLTKLIRKVRTLIMPIRDWKLGLMS